MPAFVVDCLEGKKTELPSVAVIGRKTDCVVYLPDQRISRQHAVIRQQNIQEFWFSDLGSFNGSSINNRRVTTTQRLKNGDIIRICEFEFRFELSTETLDTVEKIDAASFVTIGDIQRWKAVMLVSDLEGFTNLSEKLLPDVLAQIIGRWYRSCEEIMEQRKGRIDKFMGDAVLAYWLNPTEAELALALTAARDLVAGCKTIQAQNEKILEPLGIELSSGVGIHFGEVILSPVTAGVQTILGDAVNVTFRLESLTRELKENILISSEALTLAGEKQSGFKNRGFHKLKGRSTPLEIFSQDISP